MKLRWSVVTSILVLPILAGCASPADARLRAAKEVGILPQPAAILGRDGGFSGVAWGRSVWAYGDTVLSSADADGTTWHSNSFSITSDLDASDGISGFSAPADDTGAPVTLIAPTDDEAAFNAAHRGNPCAEAPCGARWAAWPGPPIFDEERGVALIFYGLIAAEPGDFNFRGVGQSIAVWRDLDARPERPVVDPKQAHPTLLFGEGEPAYGDGPVILDGELYSFACTKDWIAYPCTLARVPLGEELQRSAWEFWSGGGWSKAASDAAPLFDGAPSVVVSWNEHLHRWVAVYSAPLSNDVHLRTASSLTGPWSDELKLFEANRRTSDGWVYDAALHPEYTEEGGRVLYITFSRPNGKGAFGGELALVRVELE